MKQEVDTYDTYQKRIAECDEQLQQQLAATPSTGLLLLPAVETLQERSDVGAFVVLPQLPQRRIKFCNRCAEVAAVWFAARPDP